MLTWWNTVGFQGLRSLSVQFLSLPADAAQLAAPRQTRKNPPKLMVEEQQHIFNTTI